MATGGRPLSRTSNAGSDECPIWIFCVPCQRRNNSMVEAKHFCTQCEESFCETCLDFHGSFQPSKDHEVLDGPFEECFHHAGKPITIFCKLHNAVACPVCITQHHRYCEGQLYLEDVATDVRLSEEYFDIDQDIKRITKNIQLLKSSRNNSKTSLIQSRHSTFEQIKDFRKHVNNIFDDLETSVKTEATSLYRVGANQADEDISTCNNLLVEMQQLQQRLHAIDPNNEQRIFIEMKQTQDQLADIDKYLYDVSRNIIRNKYTLILDPTLEQYLTNIKSFGELSTVMSVIPDFERNSVDLLTAFKVLKFNE